MNVRKIFEYALAREREGRDFFKNHADRMSHAAAKGAFARLAAEEEQHIEYIEGVLLAIEGNEKGAAPAMETGDRFADRADAELLEQSVVEAMTPDVAVLRTAYLIERDFAEFYEMAAGKTEGEAKKALEHLARWERGHERLFKQLHDKVFEEYTEMPWGG